MTDIYFTKAPVTSGAFLTRILRERYGISEPAFARNVHGKPRLINAPLFFNLAHTRGRTFAAFSAEEIGLDAEDRSRRLPRAVFDRLDPAERQEDFFRLWTAKEAFIKYCGGSLAAMLSDLRFAGGTLFYGGAPVPAALSFLERDGCTVCVCTAHPAPVMFRNVQTYP